MVAHRASIAAQLRPMFEGVKAVVVGTCLMLTAECSSAGDARDVQARAREPAASMVNEAISTITIGVTTTLSEADNGNANLLVVQQAMLDQSATLESLSFFVTAAAGNLTLGLYDATGAGAGPGALLAHTASFAPVSAWNTQPVTSQVVLSPGTYWLAYLPSSNALGFVKETKSGAADWRGFAYGALPSSFGSPQTSGAAVNWSLYATLAPTSATTNARHATDAGRDASSSPSVATAASASPNPATGTSVNLNVLGADPAGESTLTYAWSIVGTAPAAVTFSPNGTNAAKNAIATFGGAGTYQVQVTIADTHGATVISDVTVTVDETTTSVAVTPTGQSIPAGTTLQFTATATDQFGQPIANPPSPSWAVSGGGTISSSGLFSASTAGGPFNVTATMGAAKGSTVVSISAAASPITIGVNTVLTGADSGNGNLLIAQKASLGQAATLQSLSFYVTQAAGDLTLGIYDSTGSGGGPGALLAQTASFAPAAGWNTQGVTAQVTLSAGTYWLSYLPSSNSLGFVKETTSGVADWRSFSYGSMPATFGTPQSSATVNWSLYATLNPLSNPPQQVLTSIAVSPSQGASAPDGSVQFSAVAKNQNGSPMSTQPSFAWTVGGGGTISSNGLFTAGATAGGPFTVTATAGSVSGTAQVTVSSFPQLRLAASSNGRYLVDKNGAPYLLVGDSPHDMFANVSLADAGTYLQDRATHGFNALWCEVLVGSAIGGRSDGSTYDGIVPFTKKLSGGQYDLTSPNEAYFQRVDQMINLAASHGMVVLLDTLDNDSWLSMFEANGNSGSSSWGTFLGRRYAGFDNIIWITGNDFQSWSSSTTDNALAMNIMASIRSADPVHLQTTELNYNISGSLDDATLAPYTTLAGAYTYYPSYYEVLQEYNGTSKTMPVFLEETYYSGDSYGNLTPTTTTNLMLRKVAYWTVLSGGLAGYTSGTSYYDFHSGWQSGIDSVWASQAGYWKSVITSVHWYDLIPDQSHTVVTAGYGTASGKDPATSRPTTT